MVLSSVVLRGFHSLLGYRAKTNSSSMRVWDDLDIEPKGPKKVPFYSHVSPDQIRIYQSYFDRALELSSTLEFKQNDLRFKRLLIEAAANDSLSEIDFELMRLQYVCADNYMREKYRSRWVETVLERRNKDFFPDPWAIISAVFA